MEEMLSKKKQKKYMGAIQAKFNSYGAVLGSSIEHQ